MKLSEITLTGSNEEALFHLIRKMVREFTDLNELYDTIGIVISLKQHFENGRARDAVRSFLALNSDVRLHNLSNIRPAHSICQGRKGIIEIVKDLFDPLPDWKKAFVIRHEFCHLLLEPKPSPTLSGLSERYTPDWMGELVHNRRELQVHLCMINRYPEDWLREPVGLSEYVISPRNFYRSIKKKRGKDCALRAAISNTILTLSFIYLDEHLLQNTQLSVDLKTQLKRDLERYDRYMVSWWNCLQKEASKELPSPRTLLSPTHFQDEELFFIQVSKLLVLTRFELVPST